MMKEVILNVSKFVFRCDENQKYIEIEDESEGVKVRLSMSEDIPLFEKFLDICRFHIIYPALPSTTTFAMEENIKETLKGFKNVIPELIEVVKSAKKYTLGKKNA